MGTRSEATGRVYAVKMLCEVLDVSRSSFYSYLGRPDGSPRSKRGPKTATSDEKLLSAIREDLISSPFVGEGHRKVWARLRRRGIKVGRKRVLRLMRENRLLAPVRRLHEHGSKAHDGTIVTAAPLVMWGTDGARFETIDDGWCWVFVAVDHFNDEVVGWHVCKIGDRFAALEPIRQGVRKHFGAFGQNVARGLALRMDNGPQYIAVDFRNEIRYLGISPSPAFVDEPECNGIAERFIGLLKEQCIWGHRFQTLEEAREGIGVFIARYNEEWLIERLGFRSPVEARLDLQAEVVLC